MTTRSTYLFIICFSLSGCCVFAQDIQDDEESVMEVVNSFLKAIDQKDTALFNSPLIANAQAFVQQGDEIKARTMKMLVDFPANQQWKERLNQDEVKMTISGTVASVTAPYLFYIDNVLSHCGHESFSLVKEKAGWKITSLTYTVQGDSCH